MIHGDVRINGEPIAVWQAERKEVLTSTKAVYDYEWAIFDPTDGRTLAGGTLQHRYSDGAAALASKVLMKGAPADAQRLAATGGSDSLGT